jgi:hypothetical protein
MTYTYQSDFTHVYDKFEYYSEDFDCTVCANYNKRGGNGCGRSACEFQDLKNEAIKHDRLKRPRGWQKKCLPEE